MILDAGVLIAVDRGERAAQAFLGASVEAGAALRTTAPVMAQAWRDGARQARLSKFLDTLEIHGFAPADAKVVGALLLMSGTSDVVNAHIVGIAVRLDDSIITTDASDFRSLTAHLGPNAPPVLHWQ